MWRVWRGDPYDTEYDSCGIITSSPSSGLAASFRTRPQISHVSTPRISRTSTPQILHLKYIELIDFEELSALTSLKDLLLTVSSVDGTYV